MQNTKIYAALHYARVNKLNRIVIDSPRAASRHRHQRQELPRRPAGARRPRHHRGRRRRDRPARLQGGDALAARARGRAPVRRGARGDPGRRGEAPGRRVPAEGAALQLARRRAPARGRQVRRKGRVGAPARRLAAAGGVRAHAGDDRAGHRRSASSGCSCTRARSRSCRARVDWINQKEAALDRPRITLDAQALVLLGLPAQHVDAGARGQPRARPASAATSWRSGWTARPRRSRTWAAKACPGSARRRSPTSSTSSPTSATAPTTTAASSPSAPRSPPASTSPTRSSTTTRSR